MGLWWLQLPWFLETYFCWKHGLFNWACRCLKGTGAPSYYVCPLSCLNFWIRFYSALHIDMLIARGSWCVFSPLLPLCIFGSYSIPSTQKPFSPATRLRLRYKARMFAWDDVTSCKSYSAGQVDCDYQVFWVTTRKNIFWNMPLANENVPCYWAVKQISQWPGVAPGQQPFCRMWVPLDQWVCLLQDFLI